MIRPLLAIGALVVLAAVEARYEDGGRVSYKHEEHYSYKPSYERHIADQDYRPHHDSYDEDYYGRDAYSVEPSYTHEPKSSQTYNDDYGYEHKYDHKPSYNSHKYKRSVYGYGGVSYDKSYNSYGGDSYGKSYSTYSSYKPSSYRHKREAQVLVPLGIEREGLQRGFRKIQSIVTKTGSAPNADTNSPIVFSISGEAVSGTNECKCNATLNAKGKNNFQIGAVDIFGRKVLQATGDKDCYERSCNGRPIVTLENKGTDSWFAEWVEINFDDGSSCRSKGRIGWLDDPTKQDDVTCCEKSWTGTLC